MYRVADEGGGVTGLDTRQRKLLGIVAEHIGHVMCAVTRGDFEWADDEHDDAQSEFAEAALGPLPWGAWNGPDELFGIFSAVFRELCSGSVERAARHHKTAQQYLAAATMCGWRLR